MAPQLTFLQTMCDFELLPLPVYQSQFSSVSDDLGCNNPFSLSTDGFGSQEGGPVCRSPSLVSISISHPHKTQEQKGAASGVSGPFHKLYDTIELIAAFQKRRAQNRAAQRAFRERKEKHAKDLEEKLSKLTAKYQNLEKSYSELTAAYGRLQKTLELLTQSEEVEEAIKSIETLHKFLKRLQGGIKAEVTQDQMFDSDV